MIIICPHCGLSGDLKNLPIESAGTAATCPRCKTGFEINRTRRGSLLARRKGRIGTVAVILAVFFLAASHDWKLDKDYFLEPGVWQGYMTYMGRKHPFELVIEKAQDGRMEGYMDWVEMRPRYRLAVRGSYIGNHIVFRDYEFLEQKAAAGLNDEKDVYILENEMKGTDKNGAASFHALKRESAPF